MNYLQKKLLLKFSAVLVFALILSWKNARPLSISQVYPPIIKNPYSSNMDFSDEINSYYSIKNSDVYDELNKLFTENSQIKQANSLDLSLKLVNLNTKILSGEDQFLFINDKELHHSMKILSVNELQDFFRTYRSSPDNEAFKPEILIYMYLKASFQHWDSDKSLSLEYLKTSRKLIFFLTKTVELDALAEAALLNLYYHKALNECMNSKEFSEKDYESVLSLLNEFKFEIDYERLLKVCNAKHKYEISKIVNDPYGIDFPENVKSGIKTYGVNLKEAFSILDQAYEKADNLFKNNESPNVSSMFNKKDFNAGGAFGFITESASQKSELNNFLINKYSSFRFSNDINTLKNSVNMFKFLDSACIKFIQMKVYNIKFKSISDSHLDEFRKNRNLELQRVQNKITLKVNFEFNSTIGLFSLIPAKVNFEFPIEIGI